MAETKTGRGRIAAGGKQPRATTRPHKCTPAARTVKLKPVRVWVAVCNNDPFLDSISYRRRDAVEVLEKYFPLDQPDWWQSEGITIRRATLTVDPVKPRKRKERT